MPSLLRTFTLLLALAYLPACLSTIEQLDSITTTSAGPAIELSGDSSSISSSSESVASSSAVPLKEESLAVPENALHQHRLITTYDQRQEGQYNIRADLENFMIVLIPPGPQEGLNLLDLLTKSSLRGVSKGKRKHYATRASAEGNGYPVALKSYKPQQADARGYQVPEFIEGRTPYHVDISASEDERQQVDVLPPPYYPQLIKPFHLEAEPTLIQALPPAELATDTTTSSSGTSLLYNQNQVGSQYYRSSRTLNGDSYLNTNRLVAALGDDHQKDRSIAVPIYRSDLNADINAIYPPIDVPAYLLEDAQARSWRLDEEPTAAKPLLQKSLLAFDLLSEPKTLRELARCAPGQRRDSYGVCRHIEGY